MAAVNRKVWHRTFRQINCGNAQLGEGNNSPDVPSLLYSTSKRFRWVIRSYEICIAYFAGRLYMQVPPQFWSWPIYITIMMYNIALFIHSALLLCSYYGNINLYHCKFLYTTAPSVHLTVPQDRITPISAEVQWTSSIHPCLFAESKFELTVEAVRRSEKKYSPQQSQEIHSHSGSVCFSSLQPDTTYHALLTIDYSGMSSTVIEKSDQFQTKGNLIKEYRYTFYRP